MNPLQKCNWKGRIVLLSSAAFSPRCLSAQLSCFLLHLQSFHLRSSASPFTHLSLSLSIATLSSHHLLLWSLCLLSFLSPPPRLASSQRDRNPPDLPDRRERQRAGADTPGGPGVRACAPQLQDQHHRLWRWRRPQRGAICLRAAFLSCQRPPQLDYFQTQRWVNAVHLLSLLQLRFILQIFFLPSCCKNLGGMWEWYMTILHPQLN